MSVVRPQDPKHQRHRAKIDDDHDQQKKQIRMDEDDEEVWKKPKSA